MRPAVVVLLLLLALVSGCSREFGGPGSGGGAGGGPAASPDSARTKLSLALQDPCFTDPDPRGTWPRCGRWVEETAGIARTAATALATPAANAAAAGVVAGRDAFDSRGCASTGPAVPVDTGGCIGALIATRTAVGPLRGLLGV